MEELANRIRLRGSIEEETIKKRIEVAKIELDTVKNDPSFGFYTNKIVNDCVEKYLRDAKELIFKLYPTFLTKDP